MKKVRLLQPVTSKLVGAEKYRIQPAGTLCRAQRHATQAGQWVLHFGKQYAVINAIDVPTTLEFL